MLLVKNFRDHHDQLRRELADLKESYFKAMERLSEAEGRKAEAARAYYRRG